MLNNCVSIYIIRVQYPNCICSIIVWMLYKLVCDPRLMLHATDIMILSHVTRVLLFPFPSLVMEVTGVKEIEHEVSPIHYSCYFGIS